MSSSPEFHEPSYQDQLSLTAVEADRITSSLAKAGEGFTHYLETSGIDIMYEETRDTLPRFITDVVDIVSRCEHPTQFGVGEHPLRSILQKGIVLGIKFGYYLGPRVTETQLEFQDSGLRDILQAQESDDYAPRVEDTVRIKSTPIRRQTDKVLPYTLLDIEPGSIDEREKEYFRNTIGFFASNATAVFIARRQRKGGLAARRQMQRSIRTIEKIDDNKFSFDHAPELATDLTEE